MITLEVIYILICLVMVGINAELIRKNRRIYHGLNGAAHIICWVVIYISCRDSWNIDFHLVFHIHFKIPHAIVLPFIGRLFFDVLLDIWRGRPVGYVPMNPKSIIDKVEKWIWKDNGITPKLFYLAVIVVINVNLIV